MRRRLIIELEYDLTDCDSSDIRQLDVNLECVARNAAGNGLFTDGTPATIESWDFRVEKVGAPA